MKKRLDVLLVERRLADSREKAKAIIMTGNVFVNGQREDKAGTTFDEEKAQIEIERLKHELYMTRMERDLLKKLDEIERREAYRK